jgi:DNA-binding XRE family transcriptional regulator
MSAKSIYAISSGSGPTKIGMASRPADRLARLNTASAIRLSLAYCSEPLSEPGIVERVAHRLLSEKRLNGEWFDVQAEQAEVAIRAAIDMVERGDADAFLREPRIEILTAAQIRAGRALLGWKQVDLAERSGVSEIAIKRIERDGTGSRSSTLERIRVAFWDAGVEFFEAEQMLEPGGQGIRFRSPRRL